MISNDANQGAFMRKVLNEATMKRSKFVRSFYKKKPFMQEPLIINKESMA